MIKQLYYIDGKPKWVIWGEREKIVKRIIKRLFEYEKKENKGITNRFQLTLILYDILEDIRKIKRIDKK